MLTCCKHGGMCKQRRELIELIEEADAVYVEFHDDSDDSSSSSAHSPTPVPAPTEGEKASKHAPKSMILNMNSMESLREQRDKKSPERFITLRHPPLTAEEEKEEKEKEEKEEEGAAAAQASTKKTLVFTTSTEIVAPPKKSKLHHHRLTYERYMEILRSYSTSSATCHLPPSCFAPPREDDIYI
jgi:hypothetical protein